jgi:hypothetical protein
MHDERFASIYSRLILLSDAQLQRIIDCDNLCTDTYNYDDGEKSFCPIAVAFDIPRILRYNGVEPTQDLVLQMIREVKNFQFGTVKGIPGQFYTNDRVSDIKRLCQQIIDDRFRDASTPTVLASA